LAKLELKPEERPRIDEEFEEITEGEEVLRKEKLKSKWARLEVVVRSEKRIKRLAKDIVKHFEERLEIPEGKGMIVCTSPKMSAETTPVPIGSETLIDVKQSRTKYKSLLSTQSYQLTRCYSRRSAISIRYSKSNR